MSDAMIHEDHGPAIGHLGEAMAAGVAHRSLPLDATGHDSCIFVGLSK